MNTLRTVALLAGITFLAYGLGLYLAIAQGVHEEWVAPVAHRNPPWGDPR
jgi:hypothetical protein